MIDAVSYLAVIAALLAMRVAPRGASRSTRPSGRGCAKGSVYAFGFAPIRSLLLLLALVSFMGMPYTRADADLRRRHPARRRLCPGLPDRRRRASGRWSAALYLASRPTVLGLGRIIVVAHGALRLRADRLRPVASAVAFAAADAADRLRHDGADGGQQHHPANDRGGGQARPGDELLQHGLPGHGPVRQPAGRRTGAAGSAPRGRSCWEASPACSRAVLSPCGCPGCGRWSGRSTCGWGFCPRSPPGCSPRRN